MESYSSFKETHPVLVVGSGIGGLTAAFELLRRGKKVCLIETSDRVGGLIRPVYWDGFSVDLGQKQFYDRIPKVHDFLLDLLQDGYRSYPFRVGIAEEKSILDRERQYNGLLRGMKTSMLIRGFWELVWGKLKYTVVPIRNREDEVIARRGRYFSMLFSQGFDEKLKLRPWRGLPIRPAASTSLLENIGADLNKGQSRQQRWYHPVKGCAGLVEALKTGILEMGGQMLMQTRLVSLEISGDSVREAKLEGPTGTMSLPVDELVSGLPLQVVARLSGYPVGDLKPEVSFKRGVIILYVFLDGPPSFPHTCLQVPHPEKKVGRITNYGAYNIGMTPEGKNCLAFELFLPDHSPLFQLTDAAILALVMQEFFDSPVIDWAQVLSWRVEKLPFSDPATNWGDYHQEPGRREMYRYISGIQNLYHVNRTGIDKTIHAALVAAECIGHPRKDFFLQVTQPLLEKPWETTAGTFL